MQKQRLIILTILFIAVAFNACYKDKGNYDYHPVEEPIVKLDSVYEAVVGDSLIIAPTVSFNSKDSLSFDWRIGGPTITQDLHFKGSSLRMIFGLDATRYYARLTISNLVNGMKYFHDFFIDGNTDFSVGTAVLSVENGISQFSFVKPDGQIQARLYTAVNGDTLPDNPICLLSMVHQFITPVTANSYWMVSGNTGRAGAQIKASTMHRMKYMNENFFDAPDTIKIGSMQGTELGATTGVINNKLYAGFTQTWNEAPVFGMYGLYVDGDYTLDKNLVYNSSPSSGQYYYIGYDAVKKSILRFNVYGQPMFFGTQYTVKSDKDPASPAFDPTNMGVDIIHMEQVNKQNCYVFGKAADGNIYEFSMAVNFNGPFEIVTHYKRLFSQQSLITPTTKWTATDNEIFYFTSGSKIYKYNPINQDLKALTADFGGKSVTMIKLTDQNTLVAGVEGSLYYLNISTGRNGDIVKQVDGIPGTPIDIALKN